MVLVAVGAWGALVRSCTPVCASLAGEQHDWTVMQAYTGVYGADQEFRKLKAVLENERQRHEQQLTALESAQSLEASTFQQQEEQAQARLAGRAAQAAYLDLTKPHTCL